MQQLRLTSIYIIIVLQIPSRERAVNVTPAEAACLARLFENSYDGLGRMASKGGTRHSPKISSTATVREDGQTLMYIFNYEDGGWVIVGSTREYYPILAYSDKGNFILQDDMGPVEVWLDETKGCIKNSSSQSDEEKAQMRSLWSRSGGTSNVFPSISFFHDMGRRTFYLVQSSSSLFQCLQRSETSSTNEVAWSDVPGHMWVCEGVRNALIGQLLFYTENQPYGVGSFTQGMYSHSSPGSEGGIVYRYYYMNWGWVPYGTIHYNGWFLPNDVSVNGYNLQNSRKNIYVSLNN